jgi:hypothetical protein
VVPHRGGSQFTRLARYLAPGFHRLFTCRGLQPYGGYWRCWLCCTVTGLLRPGSLLVDKPASRQKKVSTTWTSRGLGKKGRQEVRDDPRTRTPRTRQRRLAAGPPCPLFGIHSCPGLSSGEPGKGLQGPRRGARGVRACAGNMICERRCQHCDAAVFVFLRAVRKGAAWRIRIGGHGEVTEVTHSASCCRKHGTAASARRCFGMPRGEAMDQERLLWTRQGRTSARRKRRTAWPIRPWLCGSGGVVHDRQV